MNNDIYNVIPDAHWDSIRECMRIDYRKNGRVKTFRSDKFSSDGTPLTKKQMKGNVLEKVKHWDWTLTGNARQTVEKALPDWISYLGWEVTPKKGPRNQNWVTIKQVDEEPLIVRSTFEQYYRLFKSHALPVIGGKQVGQAEQEDIKTFIETTEFSKVRPRFFSDDAYDDLKKELADNPKTGDVMPGCGGLRKLRIADPKRQKGKRGGARLIYLHIPEVRQFLLLDIYGKHEKDDLSPADKKELRELARMYKREIVEAARAKKKGDLQ